MDLLQTASVVLFLSPGGFGGRVELCTYSAVNALTDIERFEGHFELQSVRDKLSQNALNLNQCRWMNTQKKAFTEPSHPNPLLTSTARFLLGFGACFSFVSFLSARCHSITFLFELKYRRGKESVN